MDPLITADAQLLVGIGALLEAGADKDEGVRTSITASLCRLAKRYPCEVLRSACLYRQRNSKITNAHLIVILKAVEKVCQEQVNMLDEVTTKELIEFSIEEMTRLKEYAPEVQLSASNILVALAGKDINQVMENLMRKFENKVVPHYTLLHSLANIANVNVSVFVPYIKGLLNLLLPLFPAIKFESIRQVFAFALGRFCEAILEYLSSSHNEETDGDSFKFSREAVASDMFIAFETMSTSWIQAREGKIVENCVISLGPMFAVLNEDKRSEQTSRLINLLLGLYRRNNVVTPYSITQCLATVLSVAPPSALESQLDSLLTCLGSMVVVIPDYKNPQTVKNHSEVLRCYDRLGGHLREKLTEHLLKHLTSGSDRDKVEGLIVTNHLLSGSENVLQPRIADIITALRALLPTQSVKVKKFLVRTVVSLICRGIAEDGSDFVEFVVKHCCSQVHQTGPDWDDLQKMCINLVHLLSSTVVEAQYLMWAVLQRLILLPDYDAACPTIAKSLALLASKINSDDAPNNFIVPPPEAVLARVLAFLGSPLYENRGPHLLNFLLNFSKKLSPALDNIWNHKIPQLVNYLEVSEWSEEEWESLLLEFVTTTIQSINENEWTAKFASQLCSQLSLYPTTVPDERGTVLKCLALASCNLNDKQIVSSHLDIILSPLRSHTLVDSKACARATGIMSRKHLNLILSRLDALSHSELNRRSSRLLGFMKDNRTDAEIECARITLLRCFAAVASEANPSIFLPRIDELMQWLIGQLNIVKDNSGRDAALHMLCNIADALDRNRETYRENLKCRAELLAILLSRIEASTVPDSLLLRATASLVKLPPTLSPEARTTLLKACFGKVFPADNGNNPDEKVINTSNVLKYLGVLVEEILLSSVNPATLDEIATLLEPWLQQSNVQQRIASITTLRTALTAYLQNMKFTYDAPSKFAQSGQMLGRIVVRCMDSESDVRKPSLACARLILLITAKYEGLSVGSDSEIDEKFSSILIFDSIEIAEDLAQIIANKLPHYQYNHFSLSMLDGLIDHEFSSSVGSAKVLVSFFTKKGGELYHHISEILSHLLSQLSVSNPATRPIVIQALLALAKHHPKAVLSTLLSQPLPFSQSVCDCWKGVVTDSSLAADVLDQFLRLGSTTPFVEENTSKSTNRPPVATHLPLAAISALKEMFGVIQMQDLAISRFPEVFTLYLSILVLYIGVSPPITTPSSIGKMKFIPNREAYKICPARVVQDSFHSFLVCARCDSAGDSLKELINLEFEENYDSFLKMMPSLTRSICNTCGHNLPRILTCFSPYFNSHSEAQRIAFISFHAECVGIQCAGQSALVDGVIQTLMSGLNDTSPLVRRLCLKGLAYISHLEERQRERHCEAVLAALMEGLDDQDTSSHSEIALQAMTGLSQVLPTVEKNHVQNIQVAIALRIKPYFEKELSVWLRMTSLRLLGELAQYGGTAMPAFQEQVRANLVCLLLHLSETDPAVVKACKFTLRSVSYILDANCVASMLTGHLIDDGNLQYQDFMTALSKHLVEEMPDLVPTMIMTALPYSKSVWSEIRGNSALFVGLIYSNSPQEIRNHVALDAITCKLLQLIKDSEKEVRCKASYALSILFVP
ncbi:maestro heat like repeat family protein c11.1 isoform X2 [Lycorma delicatula]|uniref:maestro heat like repeat family protein c11.1 isoform X2 n=1 Tax=Lycorma delicatula TaxID=130591 RepID=UPI003F50F360